jgi:hypothetical protein
MPVMHVNGSSTTAPVRNRYFYGKLLDVRHLEMEQAYFLEHRRRLNRLTVGFGVVCGLEVTVGSDGQAICIAPGFAIDGRGREILVTEQICIDDPSQLTDACGRPDGTASDKVVTICLAYHECDADPSPVLVADCDVHEGCTPGAVRERYKVLVHDGVPDGPPYPDLPITCRYIAARLKSTVPAHTTTTSTAHLNVMLGSHDVGGITTAPWATRFLPCDEPEEDCVVLAVVMLKTGTDDAEVDMWTHRRVVLSNDHLYEAILCLAAEVERCCKQQADKLTIEIESGDGQEGEQGDALPEPIVALVKDGDGNPVKDQNVTFKVTSALGGKFDPESGATDGEGHVTTTWSLGKIGPQTATASLDDGTEADIKATAKD